MLLLIIVPAVFFGALLGIAICYLARRRLLAQEFLAGKIAGLNFASEIASFSAQSAVELAPRGRLAEGMLRAQVGHSISAEILSARTLVRR